MSSKFNRCPVPRLRPPICIPPPGSCLPPFPLQKPPTLTCTIRWYEFDYVFPFSAIAMLTLFQTNPVPTYVGTTDLVTIIPNVPPCKPVSYLEAAIYQSFIPGHWHMNGILYFTDSTWNWTLSPLVPVPQDIPLALDWIRPVTNPGRDYYRISAMT